MSVTVSCDQCGKQYSIGEQLLGKRVKCAQCGAAFLTQAIEPQNSVDPLFANLPSSNLTNQGAAASSNFYQQSVPQPGALQASPPVDGPTDQQMRLGAALSIPVVILGMLLAIFAMKDMTTGAMVLIGLGPLFVLYAIAALIDPNIVRAASKYGTHLPARYKVIAFFVGLAALGCGLPLVFWVLWR